MCATKSVRSPLVRHEANLILTPDDMPVPCYSVYNAGVTMFEGKVLLLRVEDSAIRTNFFRGDQRRRHPLRRG